MTVDAASNPQDAGIVPDAAETDAGEDACPGGAVVTSMGGQLLADDGSPLAGSAQVCIRGPGATFPTCLFPQAAEADGTFEVEVPEVNQCIVVATMRAFNASSMFAESYCDVNLATGGAVQLSDPVTLYATRTPVMRPPEGSVDQARTVVFEDDVEVDVVPEALFGDYERLASRKLASTDENPCFVDATDDFDATYAFSPSINIPSRIVPDGFPFRIKNTGLSEGTEVDLYVLGSLDCEAAGEIFEEGHWVMLDTLAADADGTLSGNLPCFSWFAYRVK